MWLPGPAQVPDALPPADLARPMSFHCDPLQAGTAARAYDIQAKVEGVVAGRIELKRQVVVGPGASLVRTLKARQDLAMLKQAVFDHLQSKTIPDQCREENRTMTAEQTHDAAKAHMETLMVD